MRGVASVHGVASVAMRCADACLSTLSLSLVIGVYPGTLGVQLPSLRVVSVCSSAQMCTRVFTSVGMHMSTAASPLATGYAVTKTHML